MKFGFGEVEPVDKGSSRVMARHLFWVCIEDEAQVVLSELAKIPYQKFIEANVSPARLWPITEYTIRLFSLRGIYLRDLRDTLLWWAGRHHLEEDWCLDQACWTFEMWRQSPDPKTSFHTIPGNRWRILDDQALAHLKPPFDLPTWSAEFEFRETYVERVRKQIEDHIKGDVYLCVLSAKLKIDVVDYCMKQVNSYCDQVPSVYDSQVDARGRHTWRRTESKAELVRNIRWTVRFQVLGKDFTEIAETDNVAPSTVKRGVDSTLKLLGLKRRETQAGRPTGSQDSKFSSRQTRKRADLLD